MATAPAEYLPDVESGKEFVTAPTDPEEERIEVGVVMPSDLVASYFTTTVVPTDTRL